MNEPFIAPIDEVYLPSSSEKKQAFLMYLFVGLLLSMGKKEVSPYSYHHIKQAMGWVVLLALTVFVDFILFVLGTIVGRFFFRLIALITIPVLCLGCICIKQAMDGKYQRESVGSTKFFNAFSWLGVWILNLFDSNHYQIVGDMSQNSSQNVVQNPQVSHPTSADSLSQFDISDQIGKPLS